MVGEISSRVATSALDQPSASSRRTWRSRSVSLAAKYDWLTPRSLQAASADRHVAYGGRSTVEADARFAALAAGLALCARWSREAEHLAHSLAL